MSDRDENIEYIEAYFRNQLSDSEKQQFEEQCLRDELFARRVALFVTVEEGIRQRLLQQKKETWGADSGNTSRTTIRLVREVTLRKWSPYAAAACLLFAVAFYYFLSATTPRQFAKEYVSDHLTQLSQTMNASKDSVQQGIAAYNDRDYNKALLLFKEVYQAHPENIIAKKYLGFVYLVTKDYDKALQQFDELAAMKDVYRNPGMFLKAITLMERNRTGDEAEAKILLERVVNENADGSREAARWLKKW